MKVIAALRESPANLSAASKFTSACGLLYLASGALLLLWPAAVQKIFLDPDFVGNEAALTRILGLTVAVIGWLYIFGGRSGGRQIVAASILDRVVLVPLVLLPVVISGVFPHTLLMFAVLDPALALVAWRLLAREGSPPARP